MQTFSLARDSIPGHQNVRTSLDLEVAGEIVEIGSEVTQHKLGDRVFVGAQKGGYAEYTVTDQLFALPVPEFYSWEEAAAFGAQWFTAWVGLVEMARVREGEIVLVHAGAGGVGSAAIKLARALKLEVFATCSPHKKPIVEEMGATYLAYGSFEQELNRLNKQPDCVIETIGGDVFQRSFLNLAPMGRVICIGASGIEVQNKWNIFKLLKAWRAIPRAKMSQVVQASRGFMGLHVGYLLEFPERVLPSWQKMIDLITEHQLRPIIREDNIFPMSRAGEAHRYMQERKSIGKILLDPSK
ncbi:MAG: zinc-binding dehydrogenase [Candidatus Heimdallarchaeota archaeon]|nr:zinc-binding dehydrogenase [Candidatus Heimdallarchaeota archaeon]